MIFKDNENKQYYTDMLLAFVQNGTMKFSEIEELVNKGADVNAKKPSIFSVAGEKTVIIDAIITNIKNHGKHNYIVSYLLNKGAKLDIKKLDTELGYTRDQGYTIEVDEFRKNMKGL